MTAGRLLRPPALLVLGTLSLLIGGAVASAQQCSVRVVNVQPTIRPNGSVHIDYQVVDTSRDDTIERTRKVWVKFEGKVTAEIGLRVNQLPPNTLESFVDVLDSVILSPGDKTAGGSLDALAFGGARVVGVRSIVGSVNGCYVE
jgi:hypothetical protein